MIDTHSHLYLDIFKPDREQLVANAINSGIKAIVMPNIDSSTIPPLLETESSYAGYCHPLMGIHPTSVNRNYKTELAIAEMWLGRRPFMGIGEIGMDLYHDTTHATQQADALVTQLKWATELNLPVVIHTREAFSEIFEIFEQVYDTRLRGVFHSFSGTLDDARKIMGMPGFYIGINGSVTYKKSSLPGILEVIGPGRLLIETDAPYLPPVPYRGKRNEPAFLVETTRKLSEIFRVTCNEVVEITSVNAESLFKLKVS